jgi:hypothetical protein
VRFRGPRLKGLRREMEKLAAAWGVQVPTAGPGARAMRTQLQRATAPPDNVAAKAEANETKNEMEVACDAVAIGTRQGKYSFSIVPGGRSLGEPIAMLPSYCRSEAI